MIKYRVYDKQAKEYIQSPNLLISADGWVFDMNDFGGARQFPVVTMRGWAWLPDSVIIEQYTGLKDKNGVEIAVGDILGLYESYVESDCNTSEELEPWGEVVRTATTMMVKSVRTGTLSDIIYDGENPSEPMAEVEVIGNIHENAELLEEER